MPIDIYAPDECTDYDDATTLISDLSLLARAGVFVFRGYSIQAELLPKILRTPGLLLYEGDMLSDFEKYGNHYFTANTPIDFLSSAQHYGLPTRLIDFTLNPFIALSFALFLPKNDNLTGSDRTYYYIRFCNRVENLFLKGIPVLHSMTFGHFDLDSMALKCKTSMDTYTSYMNDIKDKYFESFAKAAYIECSDSDTRVTDIDNFITSLADKVQEKPLCFVNPSLANPRITMQQGLFLLPYVLQEKDYLDQLNSHSYTIRISASVRDELLNYLETLGYTMFRLMPDLSNVCSAITRNYTERCS